MLEVFLQGIYQRKHVLVAFEAQEDGMLRTRKCIPFDYGESRRYRDGEDRFHFYDLDSLEGKHNLSILPNQVKTIQLIDEEFNPGDYIKWKPNWIVGRDWGKYS